MIESNAWQTLKVGDIVTCSSYDGFHKIVRFHRARRFGPMTRVEFKTWNQKANEFSQHEKNSCLCNLALAKSDIQNQISRLLLEHTNHD